MDQKVKTISLLEQKLIARITAFRAERNISQAALARILGTGTSFIANVESKNHSAKYNLRHLHLLSSHFDMDACYFLAEEEMPEEVV